MCSFVVKLRGQRAGRLLSPKFNRESRLQPAAPDERSPETANMKWMFKEDHSLGENGGDVLISEEK